MNAYLNYLIEANIGLLIFLACYKTFLRSETNFTLLRIFLLVGIFTSLLFPLIHVQDNQDAAAFSISQVMPSYWLPEVVVGGEGAQTVREATFDFWQYTATVYYTGVIIVCLLVLFQLVQLFRLIHRSVTYRLKQLYIAESTEKKPIFSFFQFIFIGQAHELSPTEKQQIIQHESVHANQWHSFDILLVHILKIFFWFNPFIKTYKKAFIQLHEFEADARAVENSDVNTYCSLLAKVALQSADFRLANHFHNSLTVKRIEMMRTLKTNVKKWKLVALVMVVPFVFFFIACQDQVDEEMTEITQNSSHALIVPSHVQERFEQVKSANPEKNYVLLELNGTASSKLEALKGQYGLPKTVEVLKTVEGKPAGTMRNEAGNIMIERRTKSQEIDGVQTFAIIEFNEHAIEITEAAQENKVYTVVEQNPEFPGGYNALKAFIQNNINVKMRGTEGTVYISFIIGKDGAVSDAKVIRGMSPSYDEEALRLVQSFPKWTPGKQNKQAVDVRFVLPIKFDL